MSMRATSRRWVRAAIGPLGRLTTRGRAVLAAGFTALVCSTVLGQRDLLRVGVLLVLVPVLTTVVLGRSRYRLACSRSVRPQRVEVGRPTQVMLDIANVSSSRCGLILAEEQVPYALGSRPRFVLPGLEPGEHRTVDYQLRSDVRGRFDLGPLNLRLTDPFGMSEHRRSFATRDELIVIPRVTALAPIPLAGDWTGAGDTRPRAVATSGEDDVTTREYRQGDDLRRVHWRSTARRGELMVRRDEQPWQSRATLLLDRRRGAHRGEGAASTFEWAVATVASVAVHLTGRGYAVRLVDGSPGQDLLANPWSHEPSGLGEAAASDVLDALAALTPAGGIELQRAVHAAARTATGGLLVAALGDIAADDTLLLAGLHQPGMHCVALVADTVSGIEDSARSAPALHRLQAQVEQLRASGWDVVLANRGEPIDTTWRRVGAGRLVPGVTQ